MHGKTKPGRRTKSAPALSPYYVYSPPPGSMPSTSSSSPGMSLNKVQSYNTPAGAMVSSSLLHRSRSHHKLTYWSTEGRVYQFPQSGYITPGSSRSNSTSLLYPGPVHGTPLVPSALVPSPPRFKTTDDLPGKSPAPQNKAVWQAGVRTIASGSSTCTCFLSFSL